MKHLDIWEVVNKYKLETFVKIILPFRKQRHVFRVASEVRPLRSSERCYPAQAFTDDGVQHSRALVLLVRLICLVRLVRRASARPRQSRTTHREGVQASHPWQCALAVVGTCHTVLLCVTHVRGYVVNMEQLCGILT